MNNDETENLELEIGVETEPPKVDIHFEKQKELGNTWTFEGKEYPLLMIDGVFHSGIPIYHPTDKNKHIANLVADFSVEDNQAFFDHLAVERKQVYSTKDELTESEQKNMHKLNNELYEKCIVSGQLVKFDEDGNELSVTDKTRQEMLSYVEEYKSGLITEWLNNFHIERHFPDGKGDLIDAMLNPPDTLWFTAKVGDIKSPSHVLVFEFNSPNFQERTDFQDATFSSTWKDDNSGRTTFFEVNYPAKYRFSRKKFTSVQGVSIKTVGNPYNGSKEHHEHFRKNFNPHFWIRLADNIIDSFQYQKK